MQIQNSERFFVIGLSCIVDNGLCSQAAGTTSFASIADVLNERGIKSFQLREFNGDDGRPGKTVTFTGRNIRPLGYSELAEAKLHEKITIPLELPSSQLVDTNIIGLDKEQPYTVNMILESRFTSRAIGLVKGGWLPPALAASCLDTTILLDRNTVSEIIARFDGGKVVRAEPDFLDL